MIKISNPGVYFTPTNGDNCHFGNKPFVTALNCSESTLVVGKFTFQLINRCVSVSFDSNSSKSKAVRMAANTFPLRRVSLWLTACGVPQTQQKKLFLALSISIKAHKLGFNSCIYQY